MRRMLRSTAGIRSSVQPSALSSSSASISCWWARTPRTSSAAQPGTGGLAASARSASRSRAGTRRISASNRMSRARFLALLRAGIALTASVAGESWPAPPPALSGTALGRSGPAEVHAGAGVHADLLAGADEQRHLDLRAGLQGGRLGPAGRAVTLQPRIGLADRQLHGGRQLHVQRGTVMEGDHRGLLLQQVPGGVPDDLGRDARLVIGFGIHEDE